MIRHWDMFEPDPGGRALSDDDLSCGRDVWISLLSAWDTVLCVLMVVVVVVLNGCNNLDREYDRDLWAVNRRSLTLESETGDFVVTLSTDCACAHPQVQRIVLVALFSPFCLGDNDQLFRSRAYRCLLETVASQRC